MRIWAPRSACNKLCFSSGWFKIMFLGCRQIILPSIWMFDLLMHCSTVIHYCISFATVNMLSFCTLLGMTPGKKCRLISCLKNLNDSPGASTMHLNPNLVIVGWHSIVPIIIEPWRSKMLAHIGKNGTLDTLWSNWLTMLLPRLA